MHFLSDDLLARIRSRAGEVDATNSFPADDLADLRGAGYLGAFVPVEFGGSGLGLTAIAAEQTRLAAAAPGTAPGLTMPPTTAAQERALVAHGTPRGEHMLPHATPAGGHGPGLC